MSEETYTQLKAYRFRLEPTTEQALKLAQWSGSLRFVWNWFLAERRDSYRASEGRHRVTMYDQTMELVPMKAMFPWLGEVPSQVLQQIPRRLDAAFQRFFEGISGYPEFKAKDRDFVSLAFPQGTELNGRCIFFPKLGWVKVRFSRKVMGTVKTITVRQEGQRWYASLLTEQDVARPAPRKDNPIGLDFGVEESIALSDGRFINFPVPTPMESARLKHKQQRLSRCVRGSNRWYRALERFNRYRLKLGYRLKDFQHKATTALAKNHGLVVVEDLRLKNMVASARGSVAEPGSNVAQKAGLNRSLLMQGFGETRRQLEYKLPWLGGTLIRVPPAGTSMTCRMCGHATNENRLERARFSCVACGHTEHADTHASKNILAAGLAAYACESREGNALPMVACTHRKKQAA